MKSFYECQNHFTSIAETQVESDLRTQAILVWPFKDINLEVEEEGKERKIMEKKHSQRKYLESPVTAENGSFCKKVNTILTYLFFQLFSGSSSVSKPLSFLIPVVTYCGNIKILGCLIYQQFSKLRFFCLSGTLDVSGTKYHLTSPVWLEGRGKESKSVQTYHWKITKVVENEHMEMPSSEIFWCMCSLKTPWKPTKNQCWCVWTVQRLLEQDPPRRWKIFIRAGAFGTFRLLKYVFAEHESCSFSKTYWLNGKFL